MANPIETQIKERISSFVRELDALVRRNTLEALRGVLETSGSSRARRGPGRPRGGAASSGGRDVGAAIVAHVRANDGQTVGEIVSGVGASSPAVKKAIVRLLASGELRKTGQRRGTRYHAGTGSPSAPGSARRGKRGGRRKARAA